MVTANSPNKRRRTAMDGMSEMLKAILGKTNRKKRDEGVPVPDLNRIFKTGETGARPQAPTAAEPEANGQTERDAPAPATARTFTAPKPVKKPAAPREGRRTLPGDEGRVPKPTVRPNVEVDMDDIPTLAKFGRPRSSTDPVDPSQSGEADALGEEQAAWLAADLEALKSAAANVRAMPGNREAGRKLFLAAHNLRGAALPYGYPVIERIAANLCTLLAREGTAECEGALIHLHVEACRAAARTQGGTAAQSLADAVCTALEDQVAAKLVHYGT